VAPLSPQDQVNAVIATLTMPDEHPVAAAKQWANEKNFQQNTQGVTAYAKVAGTNWTYYVKDLIIRIGRPPDNRPSTAGSPTPPPMQKIDDTVHIDLGPSKLVSRNHAIISYDTSGEHNWQIHVLGRNGVKVDDETFKKESKTVLRSGSVIEIGGVQMMFVLPNKVPVVAPSILRRTRIHQYIVDEEMPMHHLAPTKVSPYEPVVPVAQRESVPHLDPAPPVEDARSRSGTQAGSASNAAAPGFHRGLLLESTEDVDYSSDSMKEVKPPYSYALLIAQAILSSEGEQLTLASIYQFIQDKYAFYRHSNTGWQVGYPIYTPPPSSLQKLMELQNSIRHNLSLNKAFRKIPRRTDEPGKGMKWELLPEHREEYIKKLRKPAKGGRQGSSQPGSPASPRNASKPFQSHPTPRPITALEEQRSPGSVTPPQIPSYRVQQLEAYTPDRGSRLPALRSADKTLSDTPRPQSSRLQPGTLTSAANLSVITGLHAPSPAPGGYDDGANMSAVTPAPQRQHPRLAPPSTSQLPSSYLPTSSPAPFWKYVQFGSTPAKPDGFSPLKDLNSSSPPPVGAGLERDVRELGSPLKERGGGFPRLGGGGGEDGKATAAGGEDDEDEGLGDFPGIDLTRFVPPPLFFFFF
jgi:hypothetical protein